MRPSTLLTGCLSTLLMVSPALAQHAPAPTAQQRPPSPEEMRQIMQATMSGMVPVMGQMTEAITEAQLRIGDRPETAERIASFKRNLYESLLRRGFTGDQAMQIVVHTALPSATPSLK